MTRARRHAWLRGLIICSTSFSFFYLNVAICQSIFHPLTGRRRIRGRQILARGVPVMPQVRFRTTCRLRFRLAHRKVHRKLFRLMAAL